MKTNTHSVQVAGFVAFVFPVVAFLATKLWATWAVVALFGSGPAWWPQRGLEMGLIPSLLCGIVGLIASALGIRSRTWFLIAAGFWCCSGALVVGFLYIGATF